MNDAKRSARRKLLAEIKGPWDSERMEAVMNVPPQPPSPEVQAAVDAAAARLDDDLPAPISVPTMDQLDAAWDDDEEDEAPEEDESEPELPDEGVDPVAYAEAKRGREERNEARRERRRVKAEAKKARRKARAEAAKGKQKGKSKKARPVARASGPKVVADEADAVSEVPEALDEVVKTVKAPAAQSNTWMLAVGLAIFIAAAIAVAAIAR